MVKRPRYSFLVPLVFIALAAVSGVADDASHTIPMEIRHNLPFVQVMVNGKGPFTFGIDTGTGGEALVSPAFMQKLDLPVTGEVEVGDPSGQNPHKVSTVKIKSLTVAGVEFKDVEAAQHQPSPREGECDGILGFVLFRDYLLTLDYPGKQLILTEGSIEGDNGHTVVPFTMPNNVPVVELGVGSQTIAAHLDSRGMGLSLPEKFTQNLKFVASPLVIGRGHTVSSDFEIKGGQLAETISLGAYRFPKPFVEINPVFPVANFGSLPLQHFAVTFDQKNKLMRLLSHQNTITLTAPHREAPSPPPAKP